MASAASSSSEQQSLTCAVCLDIFEDPRFLPHCHHTFCAKCIQDVADRHPGGTFHCPSCRRETSLPAAGVSGFQSNFYIQPERLERARAGVFHCTAHPKDELDLYCADCQQPVCLKCVITRHKQHTTEDMSVAFTRAKNQVQEDQTRLVKAIIKMEKNADAVLKEQKALKDKKEAVKKDIRSRHAILVAAADKSRDEALASVDDVTADAERKLASDLLEMQRDTNTIRLLQRNVQAAVNRVAGHALVDVAKEIGSSIGSQQSISLMTSRNRPTVTRPVLHYTTTAEAAVRHVSDFIGIAAKMDMPFRVDPTTVKKVDIAEDPGAEVYSICATDDGNITLSYAWRDFSEKASSERFDVNGLHVKTYSQVTGKVSWKSKGHSCMHHKQKERKTITFSKSKRHFSLHNVLSECATVRETTVTSENPFKCTTTTKCTIQCGPHRAFDVDSRGNLFAVVEEPGPLEKRRTVRLFKRPEHNTAAEVVCTYVPPTEPFQPSDVCFYKKDEREVLLVSDEINDAIHIIGASCGELKFLCYLCRGNPLLTQPTALTVDSIKRLWVACRGRRILVIENVLAGFRRADCSVGELVT